MNDAAKYIRGYPVQEWQLVAACKRFTKRVFERVRVKNQRRLSAYWIARVSSRKDGGDVSAR